MNEVKRKVKSFLKMNGMDYERIDVRKEVEIFLEDMQNGLNGKPKCLEMLPTYIPMNDEIPSHEPVIALDAGGTNFRVAVVHFDDNKKPVISDFAKYSMPGMKENMSREEFLQTIVGYLEPVIHKSNKIGFCFSYAMEMMPNGDGKLIRFSKEIEVQGMAGRPVMQEFCRPCRMQL